MKISCGVTYTGETVKLPNEEYRFLDTEERLNDLKKINKIFQLHIKDSTFACDYMIQPLFSHDRLLFFSKQELSPMSDLAKEASGSKNKPYFAFENKEHEHLMKSIFTEDCPHKQCSYLLRAEAIDIERNLLDGRVINVSLAPSVPYYTFITEVFDPILQADIDKQKFCEKYNFYAPSHKDWRYAEQLLPYAVDYQQNYNLLLDHCKGVLEDGPWQIDKDSNKKNLQLWQNSVLKEHCKIQER